MTAKQQLNGFNELARVGGQTDGLTTDPLTSDHHAASPARVATAKLHINWTISLRVSSVTIHCFRSELLFPLIANHWQLIG